MRVLTIEDRADDRELIARQLRRYMADLELVEVSNEDTLRQALEQGPCDLALTDYRLGWTDGLQVLHRVKERFPEALVIMISDSGDAEIAAEGMRTGLSDYVLKHHLVRLPAAIQSSLERARLQKELDRSLRELRQSHDELEGRVQERTVELAQANAALQQQAEELQSREQMLRLVLDSTPALISYVDAEYRCHRVNRTAERWFGLTTEEMMGHPLQDFLGPAAWEAIRPHVERALAGETVTYEQELPYEQGGPRWVRATYTPDRNETGRVRGFIAHLLDIGERRRVEEELQRSEKKYRNLVYHAPTFIYQVDFHGPRFTTVNDMMCEYIGYTREELMDMNPLDLLDPASQALFRARIQRWLRGEKPDESVEYCVRAKDGREIYALLDVTFTADEQGQPLGATVVGHDITARRQAEQEREQLLEQQENLLVQQEQLLADTQHQAAVLEATLAALTEGVLIRDLEGRIVRKNAAAGRMLGYTPEEWGRSPQEQAAQMEIRFPGQERISRVEELPFSRAMRGETVDGVLMTFRLPASDQARPYLISSAPIRLPDGMIVGTVTTARDISELHAIQAQLEEANTTLRLRNETLEIQAAELQVQSEDLQTQAEELRQQTEELLASEQALQESEARRQVAEAVALEQKRLFAVLETLPAMVCLLTSDHHIAFANRKFREMFGEPQGRPCFEYCYGQTEPCAFCQSYNVFKTGQPHHWEAIGPKGQVIEVYDVPFTDADGAPMILELDVNITERKRAEEALQALNASLEERVVERTKELELVSQRLAALMNALPIGASFSDDATCQRIAGNPTLLAQFEIGPTDNISASAPDAAVAGRQIRYFQEGREITDAELPLQRAVAEQREIPPIELEVQLPSGRRWITEASGAPVRDQAGSITGGIAVTVDITARRQAEQERERLLVQVRQDAETKETLLREVNHRVKNNLGAILGLLYAQMDRPGTAAHEEYQVAIQEVAHRIEGLSVAHELLSASQWQPLPLDGLAQRIVTTALPPQAKAQVVVGGQPLPVLVSPDQAHTLALVFNELALNVDKHASSNERSVQASIDITREDGTILLRFRDDGPGYPEEVVTGRQHGVGLVLLYNLVRQNLHGQMMLYNEGGAVAEIRFPAMV